MSSGMVEYTTGGDRSTINDLYYYPFHSFQTLVLYFAYNLKMQSSKVNSEIFKAGHWFLIYIDAHSGLTRSYFITANFVGNGGILRGDSEHMINVRWVTGLTAQDTGLVRLDEFQLTEQFTE